MTLSLAPYDQTSPTRCPRRPWTDLVSLRSGLLVPAGCYTLSCPVCVQTLAHRYSAAIGQSRPDQHVRLSLVGDAWARIRFNMNVFRRNLRRLGFDVQDAFHVEANPLGTGHHAHLWTWGPRLLDEATVSEAAVRAGMGREVWVGLRERPAGAPLWYGMKAVLDAAHPTQLRSEVSQYLELNGGRLLHATRRFWRDADGREIRGGVRAAAKLARQPSTDEWAVVTLPPV